ncbi:MAG: GntR family transcriptional regulator [bacterium]|nr:GntR family transcriptional regulator [bacterium]MDY5456970.1 GntR family transcriptional regulator [Bariatricus sp.]
MKYPVKTLREQVYVLIKSKIINGEIKPGEKIKEFELAETLGISRGPIREALRQIEQDGLVSYIPNRGCVVTQLTRKEMVEMGMIRADLEVLAVEVCEGKYSEESISKMEYYVSEMEKYANAKELEKLIEQDQLFHEAIVSEPGLCHLLKLWHTLDGTNVAIYFCMNSTDQLSWQCIAKNHKCIIDKIKTGDLSLIEDEIKRHYMGSTSFRDNL